MSVSASLGSPGTPPGDGDELGEVLSQVMTFPEEIPSEDESSSSESSTETAGMSMEDMTYLLMRYKEETHKMVVTITAWQNLPKFNNQYMRDIVNHMDEVVLTAAMMESDLDHCLSLDQVADPQEDATEMFSQKLKTMKTQYGDVVNNYGEHEAQVTRLKQPPAVQRRISEVDSDVKVVTNPEHDVVKDKEEPMKITTMACKRRRTE